MNVGRAGRFLVAGAAAIASAVFAAIVLAVTDIYLSGHGTTPLGDRRLADVDAWGVHLSVADGILLTAVLAAVVATMRVYRR